MPPFFGGMHVACLRRTKVTGLSKIPRIVDAFARCLQIQGHLTQEVAQSTQSIGWVSSATANPPTTSSWPWERLRGGQRCFTTGCGPARLYEAKLCQLLATGSRAILAANRL